MHRPKPRRKSGRGRPVDVEVAGQQSMHNDAFQSLVETLISG